MVIVYIHEYDRRFLVLNSSIASVPSFIFNLVVLVILLIREVETFCSSGRTDI
jgi:ABC-type phosphate transport system permease subunit